MVRQWLVILVAALLAASAAGQGPVTVELSFSNPGARSMGFGGAFVALADDATAAFANPAGLVQLTAPEVSLEGRWWSYATPYTAGGRASGEPTGFGLDTSPGPIRAVSSRDLAGLSFLSVVYPHKRWRLALYRHQLAQFEFSGETQGLFGPPSGGAPGTRRELSQRTAYGIDIVGHGFAGAWQVNDALSLGFGLAYFNAALTATGEDYTFDSFERFFDEVTFLPARLVRNSSWTIDDADWGLSAGFLWRLSERLTAGGFVRQGPRFDLDVELRAGPANGSGLAPGDLEAALSSQLALPDVYGLGLAFRSADDRFTVAFQWNRVEYSTLFSDIARQLESEVLIRDGDELRLGGEWVFLRSRPLVALRLGAWLDPDHRLRSLDAEDPFDRALFQPGEDELHVAAGFGIVFQRSLQIDLGLDLSQLADTVSLSAIYSF